MDDYPSLWADCEDRREGLESPPPPPAPAPSLSLEAAAGDDGAVAGPSHGGKLESTENVCKQGII